MRSSHPIARVRRWVGGHRSSTALALGARGQSIVEFALIVPLALVLLGGALDMGRLFHARISIENAAREGAVFGSDNPRCDTSAQSLCADPDTAEWRVKNEALGLGALTVAFNCYDAGSTVALTSCAGGHTYEATVSTEFDFVTPLLEPLLGDKISLEAKATAVVLSGAIDPSATPAPIPTPSPTPPPVCTVPDTVGLTKTQAVDAWEAAGFDDKNVDTVPNNMHWNDIVGSQDLAAGTDEPCETATITLTEAAP